MTFYLPHPQPQPQQLLTMADTPSLPPSGPSPFLSSLASTPSVSSSMTPLPTGTPAPTAAATISAADRGQLQVQQTSYCITISSGRPHPCEHEHTVSPQTPPPVHLRHVVEPEPQDTRALQQQQPQDREREDDAESPTPTTTGPQTETGWSPLKRLSAVADFVPNLSPLPASPLSRRKREENRLRSSSSVLSGRRLYSRSNSMTSPVQILKPAQHDTEARDVEGDVDVDMDMRSAPGSPAPTPAPRTPTRRSTIIDIPSSLPPILAVLDLFSSNEGPANPPSSSELAASASASSASEDGEEDQMDISPPSVANAGQAVSKVEKELEKEAWQLSPLAIAPISRPLSASALSFQKQLEVVQQQPGQVSPPVPEPTLAVSSTSAPRPTHRNLNIQSGLRLTFKTTFLSEAQIET
ncbi:hypothetical protein CPC08DRAFT_765681 [Agrocybe pediades]|nr:hypothetical protein CPC08DRAFT_765681 [Agrocybe pediades]